MPVPRPVVGGEEPVPGGLAGDDPGPCRPGVDRAVGCAEVLLLRVVPPDLPPELVHALRSEQPDLTDAAVAREQHGQGLEALERQPGPSLRAELGPVGSRDVVGASGQRGRDARAHIVDLGHPLALGMPDLLAVPLAVERRQALQLALGQVRDVEAAGQPEGPEEPLLHQHVEAQAGHLLEDRAHDAVVQIAVLEEHAGPPVAALFGCLEALSEVGVGRVEGLPERAGIADDVRLAGVPDRRHVGEEVAQGDRPVGVVRIAQLPAQVLRDVAVEIERAFLDELHHDDGGQGLGDRRDPHQAVRPELAVACAGGVDPRPPERRLEARLAAAQHGDGESRQGPGRVPAAVREPGELFAHVVLHAHQGLVFHRSTAPARAHRNHRQRSHQCRQCVFHGEHYATVCTLGKPVIRGGRRIDSHSLRAG